MQFGYAAQNLTIPETTNRTVRLANLDEERVRGVILQNLAGLERIIRWNSAHGMGLFRVGQQVIPFASHPAFPYDWEAVHGDQLRAIGGLARELGVRLSIHPGQFIQPGSPREDVARRSLEELRYGARLMHLLDPYGGVMVLHLGGAYDDRGRAMLDFAAALRNEDEILRHLAIENDERIWTVPEVVLVSSALGIPAIVDTLHHRLNPGGITLGEALDLAIPTWQGRPKVHLSSQDPAKSAGAHAFGVEREDLDGLLVALEGRDVDVMVEAKGKDKAVEALGVSRREAIGAEPPSSHRGATGWGTDVQFFQDAG